MSVYSSADLGIFCVHFLAGYQTRSLERRIVRNVHGTEQARENFTVDFQQPIPLSPERKMDSIARAITLVSNKASMAREANEQIDGYLSRKYARNLREGTRENKVERSHLLRVLLLPFDSPLASSSFIDYRLSMKFPLLRLSLVVFRANSSVRCCPKC